MAFLSVKPGFKSVFFLGGGGGGGVVLIGVNPGLA